MKKILLVLLMCTAFAASPKSLDLTITNNTDNISGRPGCNLEFMPTLTNFIEMPKATISSIGIGSQDKIHLDFKEDTSVYQSAEINFIARCEGFDARLNLLVIGNKYYAGISLGNKLSMLGSTGQVVTDKHVESTITSAAHNLVVKQK